MAGYFLLQSSITDDTVFATALLQLGVINSQISYASVSLVCPYVDNYIPTIQGTLLPQVNQNQPTYGYQLPSGYTILDPNTTIIYVSQQVTLTLNLGTNNSLTLKLQQALGSTNSYEVMSLLGAANVFEFNGDYGYTFSQLSSGASAGITQTSSVDMINGSSITTYYITVEAPALGIIPPAVMSATVDYTANQQSFNVTIQEPQGDLPSSPVPVTFTFSGATGTMCTGAFFIGTGTTPIGMQAIFANGFSFPTITNSAANLPEFISYANSSGYNMTFKGTFYPGMGTQTVILVPLLQTMTVMYVMPDKVTFPTSYIPRGIVQSSSITEAGASYTYEANTNNYHPTSDPYSGSNFEIHQIPGYTSYYSVTLNGATMTNLANETSSNNVQSTTIPKMIATYSSPAQVVNITYIAQAATLTLNFNFVQYSNLPQSQTTSSTLAAQQVYTGYTGTPIYASQLQGGTGIGQSVTAITMWQPPAGSENHLASINGVTPATSFRVSNITFGWNTPAYLTPLTFSGTYAAGNQVLNFNYSPDLLQANIEFIVVRGTIPNPTGIVAYGENQQTYLVSNLSQYIPAGYALLDSSQNNINITFGTEADVSYDNGATFQDPTPQIIEIPIVSTTPYFIPISNLAGSFTATSLQATGNLFGVAATGTYNLSATPNHVWVNRPGFVALPSLTFSSNSSQHKCHMRIQGWLGTNLFIAGAIDPDYRITGSVLFNQTPGSFQGIMVNSRITGTFEMSDGSSGSFNSSLNNGTLIWNDGTICTWNGNAFQVTTPGTAATTTTAAVLPITTTWIFSVQLGHGCMNIQGSTTGWTNGMAIWDTSVCQCQRTPTDPRIQNTLILRVGVHEEGIATDFRPFQR
jgi:hypothetical protein